MLTFDLFYSKIVFASLYVHMETMLNSYCFQNVLKTNS